MIRLGRVNRAGERNFNKYGSEMIIVKYIDSKNIDILFPDYDWVSNHKTYQAFRKGEVKCPYDRNIFGVGYIGEGNYPTKINDKPSKIYYTWKHMLERCYAPNHDINKPSYAKCTVCDKWHNFQSFAKWYDENYYEVPNDFMCIDKDILVRHNKVYSPDTCMIVPQHINNMFVGHDKSKDGIPPGIVYNDLSKKYTVRFNMYGKNKHLGIYSTLNEAFLVLKNHKEQYIKQVADEYKELIPIKLYNAMYNYTVEM